MKHFGIFDGDYLVGVHAVADSAPDLPAPAVALPTWGGWPLRPHEGAQLRMVAGSLQWDDPRTPAQKADAALARRDGLLAAVDRVALRAFRRGEPMPAAWAAYGQALEDIPAQPGFPGSITWPELPA